MASTVTTPRPSLHTPSTPAPSPAGLATCPSCHTQDSVMTNLALDAGADWECSRCGSRWDAARLAAVAAYAAWVTARTAASAASAAPARTGA